MTSTHINVKSVSHVKILKKTHYLLLGCCPPHTHRTTCPVFWQPPGKLITQAFSCWLAVCVNLFMDLPSEDHPRHTANHNSRCQKLQQIHLVNIRRHILHSICRLQRIRLWFWPHIIVFTTVSTACEHTDYNTQWPVHLPAATLTQINILTTYKRRATWLLGDQTTGTNINLRQIQFHTQSENPQ